MAIPKAAVEAILKELALSLEMKVEVRSTGNVWTDGIFVTASNGAEAQFVRRTNGVISIGWPEENFDNGPEHETQQEFKKRALFVLKDLM